MMHAICEALAAALYNNTPLSIPLDDNSRFAIKVHGVGPLLHAQGNDDPWLAQAYQANKARIEAMYDDLTRILQAFAQHGISVMPLKGAALTPTFYDDPAIRPMADLDLLVRPADRNASIQVLHSLGYITLGEHWKHVELVQKDNQEIADWEFEHAQNPRKVDLHIACHELFGGPRVDLTALMWDSAQEVTLFGSPVMLPSPDILWLHLLCHSSSHIWGGNIRLIQLWDAWQMGQTLENTSIIERVESRYTYLALRLLQRIWGIELPMPTPTQRLENWAQNIDLVNASFLGRHSDTTYLRRLWAFYTPPDIASAGRFLLETKQPLQLVRRLLYNSS